VKKGVFFDGDVFSLQGMRWPRVTHKPSQNAL